LFFSCERSNSKIEEGKKNTKKRRNHFFVFIFTFGISFLWVFLLYSLLRSSQREECFLGSNILICVLLHNQKKNPYEVSKPQQKRFFRE